VTEDNRLFLLKIERRRIEIDCELTVGGWELAGQTRNPIVYQESDFDGFCTSRQSREGGF
jgi:hypothetical protein